MVIIWLLFKMIVGKVLCLFGLFTIASAYISTCTELSWQKKTGGENFSFYNAGNVNNIAKLCVCLHKMTRVIVL